MGNAGDVFCDLGDGVFHDRVLLSEILDTEKHRMKTPESNVQSGRMMKEGMRRDDFKIKQSKRDHGKKQAAGSDL